MAVRNETKTVREKRVVNVAKAVGVTYASDSSSRKLKVTKSQRSAGSFVVTLDNDGSKSIVITKAQLVKFLDSVKTFVVAN